MLHRERSKFVLEVRKRAAPFCRSRGRRALSGSALVVLAAAAIAVIGAAGAGTSFAQAPDFCPPTFDGPNGSLEGTPAHATRQNNGVDVTLSYSFNPSACQATMTVTGVDGNDVQIPLSTSDPVGTSRAVRVTAGNLCVLSHAHSLDLLGGKTAHGQKPTTCEQALLAFYIGPTPSKTGTAVRAANTCELLAISAASSKVATAHREKIPITLTITQVSGQQNLLGDFALSLKVSDGSAHGVRATVISEPVTKLQFKQCNAP
jgi:hypothetical protein